MTDIVTDSTWTEQTASSDADLSQVVLNKLEEVGGNISHSVYVADFENEPTTAYGTLPSGWQFGKNSGIDWSSTATNAGVKELTVDANGTVKKGINIYSTNGGSTVIGTTPLGTNSYVGSNISKYTKVDIELISYNGYNHYFINGKLMASVAKTDRGINDDVVGFTAWCADYHITDFAVYALTDEESDTTLVSDKFFANYVIAENTSDKWKNAEITLEKSDESGEVVNTLTISANTVIICEEGSTYRFSVKAGTKSDSI